MDNSKYLIVNADDYGRTPGVSKGIREAHKRGIITSTTVMMNMPGVEAELERALKAAPKLGLGVHLVLTSGAPVLPADRLTTLTRGRGRFPSQEEFIANLVAVDADQAAAEWEAQVQKFIQTAGRSPDHLDSHHHASFLTEKLFEQMLALAQKYDCPIRSLREESDGGFGGVSQELSDSIRKYFPQLTDRFQTTMPNRFIGSFYDETATEEQLLQILRNLGEGTSELMCHPGYADEILIAGSVYNRQRERELGILTSEPVRKAIQEYGIQLINFGDLKKMQK